MTRRLHKVLLDATHNAFALLTGTDGKPLDLNAATKAARANCPPYTEVCLEVYEVFPERNAENGLHNHLVLRGHAMCCCAGACANTEDHHISPADAFSRIPHMATVPGEPVSTPHGPGQGYVQGMLSGAQIRDMHIAAVKAAGGALTGADGNTVSYPRDEAACAALGKRMFARASQFELSASEIELVLGHAGVEKWGRASAPGAVAAVFAGSATETSDYYWAANVIASYSHLVGDVFAKLSRHWSTLPVAEVTRLAARHATSAGGAQ